MAFSLILDAIESCFGWMTYVFTGAGYLDTFLGIIIISIVNVKIVSPLMRGRGSDHADRRRSRKDSGSENG